MEPSRSVFLWLLELMFEVTKNSHVNNMGIKEISKFFVSISIGIIFTYFI